MLVMCRPTPAAAGPPMDSPSISMGSARKSGIQPIAALNPYNMSWTIKARLVKKGMKRSFSKGSTSTSVFSLELVDNQVWLHVWLPGLVSTACSRAATGCRRAATGCCRAAIACCRTATAHQQCTRMHCMQQLSWVTKLVIATRPSDQVCKHQEHVYQHVTEVESTVLCQTYQCTDCTCRA